MTSLVEFLLTKNKVRLAKLLVSASSPPFVQKFQFLSSYRNKLMEFTLKKSIDVCTRAVTPSCGNCIMW